MQSGGLLTRWISRIHSLLPEPLTRNCHWYARLGDVPGNTTERDDGWRAFRIVGILDFSLIGILSKISAVLADNGVGIFAISTYNTDYILTKEENFDKALKVLAEAGYEIEA